MNKIVAFVGMPGAGKTEASLIFKNKGFSYLRFGQIVLDEVLKRGEVSEHAERDVRNSLRREHGMGVMAILSLPKIDELLSASSVVIDDLYSWEEYKILKEKYENNLIIVAVYCSPSIRYQRLTTRHFNPRKDPKAIYRSYTKETAKSRDYSQIQELDQGGPIAMADYCLVNEGSKSDFHKQVEALVDKILANS